MEFLKAIFGSKKLGAAMAGLIVQLATTFGLDPEVANKIGELLMVYIASQGVVDLGLAVKGSKT